MPRLFLSISMNTTMASVLRVIFLVFFSLSTLYAAPTKGVAARVNGSAILLEDLRRDPSETDPKVTLERQILYELAVQDAIRKGLDKTPQFIQESKKLLYKSYLNSVVATDQSLLNPSFTELEGYYMEQPLVRIRHLLLYARNPREKRKAEDAVATILRRTEEKVPFKSLVLEFSEDTSVNRGGDTDFRGFHQLPEAIYSVAKKMEVGAVSEAIRADGMIHVIQLLDRKDYSDIPASYRELLKHRLSQQREMALLTKQLSHLRAKANIEVLSPDFK